MPMNMRNDISEAGQIDLVGGKQLTNNRFDGINDMHQRIPRCRVEVRHLANVFVPDDTAKAGVIWIINPNNSAFCRLPEDSASRTAAKFAGLTTDFHAMTLRCAKRNYSGV